MNAPKRNHRGHNFDFSGLKEDAMTKQRMIYVDAFYTDRGPDESFLELFFEWKDDNGDRVVAKWANEVSENMTNREIEDLAEKWALNDSIVQE